MVTINSSQIQLARVEMMQDGGGGPILGIGLGDQVQVSNIYIVNNEIHQSGGSTPYGVYVGGGSVCASAKSSYDHLYFYHNIIRDICGRPIQLEPRNSSTNDFSVIEGNVIHDSGQNFCGSGWGVSAAVGLAGACGASFTNHWVRNNLFFNVAGAFGDGSGTNHYFTNNTVYNYGLGTATSNSHAVNCYDYSCTGVIENNILLKPNNGVFPINRGNFTTNKNLCESSGSCGQSPIVASPSAVFSSLVDSLSFLKLKAASPALAVGLITTNRGVLLDYMRKSRVASTAYDLGAFASNVSSSPKLLAPVGLRVVN